VIPFYSIAYSQTIKQVGNGVFQIDRAYAEMIAQQADSLNRCNDLYMMSYQALNNCIQAVESRDGTITILKQKISAQEGTQEATKSIITHKDAQISTLEKQTADLQGLVLKIERKHKRKRFIDVACAIAGGAVTGLLIGLIVR
jgi:septal ring factor EnvC (AmiA/AmiB activator)